MGLRRDIRAYIEAELRDFHQTKQALAEARDEILHGSPVRDNNGGSRGGPGNPTEKKALSLVTNKRITQMDKTVRAIEVVVGELPEDKLRLVELKYWQRPRTLTDLGMAQEIGCDRATFYRWIDGILLAIAVELGLISDPRLRQTCDI